MTDWSKLDGLAASLLKRKGETLSGDEIKELEALLGARLPADYVRFITHQGGGYCNANYGIETADGFFAPIDDFMGRSWFRYDDSNGVARWRFIGDPERDDLHIAGDLMGQLFLLSASTGRIRWLDHETGESVPLTDTFTELLERMEPLIDHLQWLDEYGLPKLAEPLRHEVVISQLGGLGSGSWPLPNDYAWFLDNIGLPAEVDLVIKPLESFRLKRLRGPGTARDGIPEVAQSHEVVVGDDSEGNPLLYSLESGNMRHWDRSSQQATFVGYTFGQLFQLISPG